ncbi:putative bifunctional diguanylate cyclase/phosphodiesterase, partial [Paraconexibacter sp.]|uniref:putative bifunctional diguanylate cyclase/phosphodiesterase n=1 Tax=Paraconexibacter sp. TaxID=2949640 RepID=UPI0035614CCF
PRQQERLTAALRSERRARGLVETHHLVHGLMTSGSPLSEVLDGMVRGVQSQTDGLRGSVLVLDDEKRHLSHASAPDLPREWGALIDGIEIGPAVGSCGTAAYLGEDVFAHDVRTDPRWAAYHEHAVPLGLLSCWSVPIRSEQDEVLGTVAFYGGVPRSPTPDDVELLHDMARLAATVLERHREGSELRTRATTDPLTSLPNRAAILERLEAELRGSRLPDRTVLFLDLDAFKAINDTFGHDTGDEVLRGVAAALVGAVRVDDLVGRWGGDEFVVIPGRCDPGDDGRELAARLREVLADPILDAAGRAHRVEASIGVARVGGVGGLEAIRQADTAMYAAKRDGGGVAAFSTDVVASSRQEAAGIVDALSSALEDGQFALVYQPVVDLHTGTVTGFEALLRWHHPDLGEQPPARFLPAAERLGVMARIEEWTLAEAFHQAVRWNALSPHPLAVGVNLARPRAAVDPVATRVLRALERSGLAPGLVRLEVTEGLVRDDRGASLEDLAHLRGRGAKVVLDDFGTGGLSLDHLADLPIDTVKIDSAFVREITPGAPEPGLLGGITGLARSLGLDVVAKGIETVHEAEVVRAAGIRYGQGYLYAAGLAPAPLEAWMRTHGATMEVVIPDPRG